jgi:hypothetical protein
MAQKKSRLIWFWLVAVLFTAWFFTTEEPRASVESWLAERGIAFTRFGSAQAFEVFDTVQVPPAHGTSMIRGTIRNTSDRHYRVVRVLFDLVDEDGKKVGSAVKFLSRVGPGETRSFEAPTHGAGFADFRLKEATGW